MSGSLPDRDAALRSAVLMAALEATPDGVLVVEAGGRVSHCNAHFRDLWGLPHDLALSEMGAQLEAFVRPRLADPDRFVACIGAADQPSESSEDVLDLRDGRRLERRSTPLSVEGREPARVWFFRDITAQKRAEEARADQIAFLEAMERVDRAIRGASDLDELLTSVIETVRQIFACDRSWLLYPCDPEAPTFRVPVESTRSEYPGAFALDLDIPMKSGADEVCAAALASEEPVPYGPGEAHEIYPALEEQFGVRAQLVMAVYPKVGAPWMVGMHQCSHARKWTERERHIFREIGRRLADALSSVLFLRDLRQSEERYRALFEQAAVGIALVGLDGGWVQLNRRMGDILGSPEGDQVGRRWDEHLLPADADLATATLGALVRGERESAFAELRFAGANSEPICVNLAAQLVRDRTGAPRYISCVAADITERRSAEAERERLAAILEATSDLVSTSSRDAVITYLNEAGRRLLGWADGEPLASRRIPDLHPGWAFERIRTEGLPAAEERGLWRGETAVISASGEEIPVSQVIMSHRDAAGQIEFFSTIMRDISDRKRAETQRQALEAQLRQSQKMEAVGQLAGGVAHDFNNILTAILGSAEIARLSLADAPGVAGAVDQGLGQIVENVGRAADLTGRLLAFSRSQVSNPRVIDVNRVVAELQSMLRRLLAENVTLASDLSVDVPPVCMDAGELQQIVLNLVINARDAMPDGGLVTVATERRVLGPADVATRPHAKEGPHVRLSVRDTGIGMDASTAERIFEPFFSTKPAGKGTGLGLATVYAIVRRAGGHVSVETAPGAGTTFEILLPATREAVASTSAAVREDGAPGGGETILVCEDDELVRELTVSFLAREGYRVITAVDGRDALEKARGLTDRIDLLVTDVIMPHLNGRQLSDALGLERPGLKTLFLSGYTADVLAPHGVLEKGVAFLSKPYSRMDLLRKVRTILDR